MTSVGAIATAAAPAVLPAKQFFGSLLGYVNHKWEYVKKLKENFEELEGQEQSLLNKEADVKRDIAANVDRIPTEHCNTWLSNVLNKKETIQNLRTRHQNINKCFGGLCPFPSLLRLGRDIVKETQKIKGLIDEKDRAPTLAAALPDQYRKTHAPKLDDCPSLNERVKEAQELLKGNQNKTIRILGLPGIGKTTVMQNLHDKFIDTTNEFDKVFWVSLTGKECVGEIQQQLEEQLGLQVREMSSNQTRAAKISKVLENKRYLLFLDQVSSEIDLRKVGIYHDHHHGKVVFACTNKYIGKICGETSIEEVKITRLSEDDAQKMFKKKVAVDIMRHPEIDEIAERLVKECGGVPLLIHVIALKLSRISDPAVWRNTLSHLQTPSLQLNQQLEDFYRFFKLVYNNLKEFEKPCLLYWEVFPAGYEIHRDYIIECWRTEQFLTEDIRLAKTRDSGHHILNEFVETGVVERGTKSHHYKMFELFHCVTRQTANDNGGIHQVLVKEAGKSIKEEEWRLANRISLISSRVGTLPDKPECSGILTLLLQENQHLTSIPQHFFTSMENLQLLDLHDTKITSLPESISSLRKLKSLYLNNCKHLSELPSEIGQLQSLEIFDLSGTGVHGFLQRIFGLTNLKCLRVSFQQNTTIHNHIQAQPREKTLSGLTSLEELSIGVNHSNTTWNHIVDAIVDEVVKLKELTTLCFYFPKVDSLETFVSESKSWNRENDDYQGRNTVGSCFRSFNISVGYHPTNSSSRLEMLECSAEKHLRFSAGAGNDIPNAILLVLKQARAFELIGHQNVRSLSVFGNNELRGVEICKVEECKEMSTIIDGQVTGRAAFECLRKLYIINIPRLVHIWEGSMERESLPMLTTLVLKGCPMLKHLFSKDPGIIQELPKLQHLEVEDCLEMEEIIETGSDVQPSALPKLKIIELRNLPKLLTVCKCTVGSMEWRSLERIEVKSCEMLRDLPSSMQFAVKLRMIRCTRNWMNELQWPSEDVKQLFQNRFHYINV